MEVKCFGTGSFLRTTCRQQTGHYSVVSVLWRVEFDQQLPQLVSGQVSIMTAAPSLTGRQITTDNDESCEQRELGLTLTAALVRL